VAERIETIPVKLNWHKEHASEVQILNRRGFRVQFTPNEVSGGDVGIRSEMNSKR
jgi:hypothetical protein